MDAKEVAAYRDATNWQDLRTFGRVIDGVPARVEPAKTANRLGKTGMAARAEAVEFLEASQIQWKRDWDAIAVGFLMGCLLGILSTVAVLLALK